MLGGNLSHHYIRWSITFPLSSVENSKSTNYMVVCKAEEKQSDPATYSMRLKYICSSGNTGEFLFLHKGNARKIHFSFPAN